MPLLRLGILEELAAAAGSRPGTAAGSSGAEAADSAGLSTGILNWPTSRRPSTAPAGGSGQQGRSSIPPPALQLLSCAALQGPALEARCQQVYHSLGGSSHSSKCSLVCGDGDEAAELYHASRQEGLVALGSGPGESGPHQKVFHQQLQQDSAQQQQQQQREQQQAQQVLLLPGQSAHPQHTRMFRPSSTHVGSGTAGSPAGSCRVSAVLHEEGPSGGQQVQPLSAAARCTTAPAASSAAGKSSPSAAAARVWGTSPSQVQRLVVEQALSLEVRAWALPRALRPAAAGRQAREDAGAAAARHGSRAALAGLKAPVPRQYGLLEGRAVSELVITGQHVMGQVAMYLSEALDVKACTHESTYAGSSSTCVLT